ncbi:MAG TPA: TIGR03067 domain-containing protein [Urbifossiella sp.]|jgi:uncharacterized protein (TIGR03067 family)|nr:TIGR03067 domain-containing protein [Urbifossiella sp.]
MVRVALVGVVFAVGVAGPLAADDATLKTLAGSYKVVGLNKAGKDAPPTEFDGFRAKIAGDQITFTVKGKEFPAKIKVDPAKTPAHLDLSPTDGPEKGMTFPGVYKLEKGELVLAFTEKSDRPSDFKGGDDVMVLRLKKDDGK